MSQISEYISKEEISNINNELASKIDNYCSESKIENLMVVGILNGAFIFCADLVRAMKTSLEVDFFAASSYGEETESSGKLDIRLDIKKDLKGRDILIVEDIIDTGLTLKNIKADFLSRGAKSVHICTLLHKPSRQIYPVDIDFIGRVIEDHFVVGYGLDFAEKYRELPFIGVVNNEDS
jgi:hypoxanthine phosphoribosyltransferase